MSKRRSNHTEYSSIRFDTGTQISRKFAYHNFLLSIRIQFVLVGRCLPLLLSLLLWITHTHTHSHTQRYCHSIRSLKLKQSSEYQYVWIKVMTNCVQHKINHKCHKTRIFKWTGYQNSGRIYLYIHTTIIYIWICTFEPSPPTDELYLENNKI